MAKSIKVVGIRETLKKLDTLDKKIAKRALRKAANAGGQVVLQEVRRSVPVVNRGLKKSLAKKTKTYSRSKTVVAVIGQDLKKSRTKGANLKKRLKGGGISGRGDIVPSHLVENATAPHAINSLNSFPISRRERVVTRRISHPGTRGAGFISGVDRTAANRAAAAKLTSEVNAETNKLRVAT